MKKNGKIELLRFLMSMVILIHHTYFVNDKVKVFFPRGSVAVEFFFLLSGYFMAARCKKLQTVECKQLGSETISYVGNKIKGILPNLILAAVIVYTLKMIAFPCKTAAEFAKRTTGAIIELFQIKMAGIDIHLNNGVTWYISAMLIAILLLYPICRKWYDMFVNVYSLFLGIMIIGMLCLADGTQTNPTKVIDVFFVYKGMLRGIAEIALGAFVYGMAERINKIEFTKLGIVCLSVVEFLLYLVSLILMQGRETIYDVVILFVFVLALILSFGKSGTLDNIFNNKFVYFLGKISLSIYLGHSGWFGFINIFFADRSFKFKGCLLILLAFITAFFIHYMSKVILIVSQSLKKNFIVESGND